MIRTPGLKNQSRNRTPSRLAELPEPFPYLTMGATRIVVHFYALFGLDEEGRFRLTFSLQ